MKMKTYKFIDGGTITADTPESFVGSMAALSKFDNECTSEEYMKHFAERFKVQCGEVIKTADPETFLSELIRLGFVQEVEKL